MSGSEVPRSFRLAYVPGATPSKWVRVWSERRPDTALELVPVPPGEAEGMLARGEADAGIVRLPVDRTRFSAIPLYTETTVVIVPKDHVLTAADEITVEDLADEVVLHPLDDTLGWDTLGRDTPPGEPAFERPATTEDAVELVAAGIGVLLVPQSLARLHHRRDLTYRPMGEDVPQSSVALSWPEDATTDDVDDFIGIVRGRTANSTRGRDRSPSGTSTDGAPDKGGRTAKESARKASPARSAGGKSGAKSGGRAGSGRAGGGGKGGGARRSSGGGKPRRRS